VNKRIVLHVALAVVLSICGSGCCTALLLGSAKYTSRDTFNPSALYQTTNRDGFALKGTQFKDTIGYYQANTSRVFVIMPKEQLVPINLRTNNTLSLSEIQTLQPERIKGAKTKTQLPANFEKVADLPPNGARLVLKEHHRRRIYYVFVPVTVGVDAATAPFQAIGIGLFLLAMRNGGC
jgi:hypothetical protein